MAVLATDGSSGRRLAESGAASASTIAFVTMTHPTSGSYAVTNLFLMAADGRRRRRVPTPRYLDRVAWSPTGRRVVFSTARPRVALYVADADGSNRRRIRVRHGGFDTLTPFWSPDGRRIAFERYDDGCHAIYVMRADGSFLKRLTKRRCGGDQDLAWSPDSRRIAFTSFGGLVVMDADGRHRRPLTTDASVMPYDNFDDKAWLPGAIFFINRTFRGEKKPQNQEVHLFRIAPDGSQLKDLTPDESRVSEFEVALDRNAIAYSSRAGVFRIDIFGNGVRQLAPRGWELSLAPNSRRLAFIDRRGNTVYINAINVDGSGKTNLTHSKGDACCLAWLRGR